MPTSEAKFKKSMHEYGKETFNEKEQIQILFFILEDAKNKFSQDKEMYQLITEHQLKLNNEENLKKAIKTVNQFIIDLEAKDHNGAIITYLKKHGLYRILYRNPQIMGEELPEDDILNKLLRTGFIGVATSALIILLFTVTAFFAAPFWLTAIATGLFVGASVYLSGILYGVINDLFATHANLPYFLLGHQPQQKSLLKTNDKFAQGIAWGVAATVGPVVIATILFTVAATITAFFVPVATFLLPLIMIAIPLIAIGAEFYARKKAREYMDRVIVFLEMGANEYQQIGLNYMSPTRAERAAWYANSDRNLFGFTKVPLVGLGALVALIGLSAVSPLLPAWIFMSPIIAVVVPVVFAAVACITLIAAGIYTYVNRNKQIDDRCRLEFDRAEIEPNLYLDEDMLYVRGLIETYGKKTSGVEDSSSYEDQSTYEAIFNRKPEPTMPGVIKDELDGEGFAFK